MRSQICVCQFYYEGRDVRDKSLHPATFPISLARRVIELFTHRGELLLDPFAGSGTSLLAAQDLGRNALGFDLQPRYVDLANGRLERDTACSPDKQLCLCEDARAIASYLSPETVGLIF